MFDMIWQFPLVEWSLGRRCITVGYVGEFVWIFFVWQGDFLDECCV